MVESPLQVSVVGTQDNSTCSGRTKEWRSQEVLEPADPNGCPKRLSVILACGVAVSLPDWSQTPEAQRRRI